MRKVLALLFPLLLVLSACGGSDEPDGGASASGASASGVLDAVTVTAGAEGEAPEVEFPTPLDVTDEQIKQLSEGDGAEVEDGSSVTLRLAVFNAEDGEAVGETYTAEAGEKVVMTEGAGNPTLYDAVVGATVGSQFAYAVPGAAAVAEGAAATPARLLIFTIEAAEAVVPPLDEVEGEAVAPVEGLPTVEVNDDGVPTITIPEGAEEPDTLVAQDLIKGDGAVIEPDDSVTIHYTGVQFSDGEQFDSSWDKGAPATFPLSGVIEGWTEGLSGKTVGSRVLLVIPPEMAYGDDASSGGPSGTLVFVVDILGVS